MVVGVKWEHVTLGEKVIGDPVSRIAVVVVGTRSGRKIVVVVVVVNVSSVCEVSAMGGVAGVVVLVGCGGAWLRFNSLLPEGVARFHINMCEGSRVVHALVGALSVRCPVRVGSGVSSIERAVAGSSVVSLEPRGNATQLQERTATTNFVLVLAVGFPCCPLVAC